MKKLIEIGGLVCINKDDLVLYKLHDIEKVYCGAYYVRDRVIREALCVESKLFPTPYVLETRELSRENYDQTIYFIDPNNIYDDKSWLREEHRNFTIKKTFSGMPPDITEITKL